MARIMYFLSRCRKKHSDFFKEFRSQATANPFVIDGECKLQTLHRADLSRATHAFFSRRVHVAQDRGILLHAVCVLLKNHSISSVFHRALLDPQLSSPFSTSFPTRAPGSSTSLSLAVIPVVESIHCHSARMVLLWPIGGTIPSRIFTTPSLSSKSAANTLRSSYIREEAVSTRPLTISRPLWMRLMSAT